MPLTFDVAGSHLYILPKQGQVLEIWLIEKIEEVLDLGDVGSRDPDFVLAGSERDIILLHLGKPKRKALDLGIPLVACYLGAYNYNVQWRIVA